MKNISSSIEETGLPFVRVPHAIIRGGHKPQFLAVLLVLLSRSSNADDSGNWCFASRETIAKDAGVSVATVQRAFKYWRKTKIEGFELVEKKQTKYSVCHFKFKINYAKTRQITEGSNRLTTALTFATSGSNGASASGSNGASKESSHKGEYNTNLAADAAGSHSDSDSDSIVKNDEIVAIFDIFRAYNRFQQFGNKAHREAARSLIVQLGFEKAKELAQVAVDIQGEKFAPAISNPYQLLSKYGAFKKYLSNQDDG